MPIYDHYGIATPEQEVEVAVPLVHADIHPRRRVWRTARVAPRNSGGQTMVACPLVLSWTECLVIVSGDSSSNVDL